MMIPERKPTLYSDEYLAKYTHGVHTVEVLSTPEMSEQMYAMSDEDACDIYDAVDARVQATLDQLMEEYPGLILRYWNNDEGPPEEQDWDVSDWFYSTHEG